MSKRIIQLDKEQFNDQDDYITNELYFDNGFLDSEGTHVYDDSDKKEDLIMLLDRLPKQFCNYNENSGTINFLKGIKEQYFKEKFKHFYNSLSELNLDLFSGVTQSNKDVTLNDIEQCLNRKHGIYIHQDISGNFNNSYITLDNFIRDLDNDKDSLYYIGSTLRYK